MSENVMGAVITGIAILILLIVIVAFIGPSHNILLEGATYIFEWLNASRVGLGL